MEAIIVTRLGVALSAISLMIAGGAPVRAGRSMSSIVSNSPEKACEIPIPAHLARPAKLLWKVAPKYPAEAKKNGIQGTVRLRELIGKDGHVEKLSVVSGPPILVKAAEDAVRQWVYKPALLNGKPVEVPTFITVVFTLPKHEKDKENHA